MMPRVTIMQWTVLVVLAVGWIAFCAWQYVAACKADRRTENPVTEKESSNDTTE